LRVLLNVCLTALVLWVPLLQGMPTEQERFNTFLDNIWQEELKFSPTTSTYLGMKENQDQWDDDSFEAADEELKRSKIYLKQLDAFNLELLSQRARLQHAVLRNTLNRDITGYKWRFHNYAVSPINSPIDEATAFLINFHGIDSQIDAEAFISRVRGIPNVVDDVISWVRAQAEKGVRPPVFAYPKVLENSHALLTGRPFDTTETDSSLLDAFKNKLANTNIPAEAKAQLVADLNEALKTEYRSALNRYIEELTTQQTEATKDHGVWKHPDGKAFYDNRLAVFTTLPVTAEEVHELGLSEVARIQQEIKVVQKQIGFEGDLESFLTYMREDPTWYYPETDAGREAYLEATQSAIDKIELKIDDAFNLKPKANLIVKRVEPFREKNTSAAFYNAPAIDGSRPGIYYVPLYRMKDNSKWDMISTAYHEALPGHHMQIAIAQELPDTPMLMKMMFVGAYVEGWALYAEYLAWELGMYEKDPVGNFGRLAAELFRAVRLVVDTGIHAKKWTREQAINYMVSNTPYTEGYATGEIERYIAWPGQAVSYKMGMLKIQALRAFAEEQLGDKFDIKEFHDVVLSDGQVPLPVLEQKVNHWVKEAQSDTAG